MLAKREKSIYEQMVKTVAALGKTDYQEFMI